MGEGSGSQRKLDFLSLGLIIINFVGHSSMHHQCTVYVHVYQHVFHSQWGVFLVRDGLTANKIN